MSPRAVGNLPERTMMACGCVSHAIHRNAHDGLPEGHASCFTHDCCEVVSNMPDLSGRTARCAYYKTCHSECPSSVDLAFFEYRGPGSPDAARMCAHCAYADVAHLPAWKVEIEIERRWFKIEHHRQHWDRVLRAPDHETATLLAEQEAERFRQMRDTDTAVRSATVKAVRPTPDKTTCGHFEPHGPWDHDVYYCGCHGWD